MSKETKKEIAVELFKTADATNSIEEYVKQVEADADNENNKPLIASQKEAKKKIIYEYILDVSTKAENLASTLKSLGDKINKPDIIKAVRVGDTSEFKDASEYSIERSKLLKEAIQFYGAFITLYDKAYLHGTKQNWKSVEEKFKAVNNIIKNINSHLGK